MSTFTVYIARATANPSQIFLRALHTSFISMFQKREIKCYEIARGYTICSRCVRNDFAQLSNYFIFIVRHPK